MKKLSSYIKIIIESIISNSIWYVITVIFSSVLSMPIIKTIIDIFGKLIDKRIVINTSTMVITTIIIASCLSIIMTKLIIVSRRYPSYKWLWHYGHNKYTFTFENRTIAEYTKQIEVIPFDNVREITGGDYMWSGDRSILSIVETDLFDISMDDVTKQYSVISKYPVKKYQPFKYTVSLSLTDTNLTMKPFIYVGVIRPTKSITIILNVPSSIGIRNVNFIAYTQFGEKQTLFKKKGTSVTIGGDKIKYTTYTLKVKNPKLICNYQIEWDWV